MSTRTPVTGQPALTWLEHFQARVILDALLEGTAAYWERRAAAFEAAKPIEPPGGFADVELAREQWRRCHRIAQACRHRSALGDLDLTDLLDTVDIEDDLPSPPEVDDEQEETAA